MNKTSYSKRGLIAFSALLIVAILLSLTLTDLFSSKAEETVASDQAKGNTQASNPSSSSPANNDDNVVEDVDVAQPKNDPAPSKPIPGQVVVQFSPNSSEQERAAYVESLGGTVVNTIEALDTVVLNVPEEIAQAPLPVSPIVEQAEQAHFVSALGSVDPNDPNYASQWALSAINASTAWAQIPANTPIVTVAVIDTGICSAHEDLAGRISAGWDFIENDANPQDAHGHGCFVSGLIAANMNNGIGIAGVAPNTRIMPLRVLDASGNGSDSNVAVAIVYAADHGAQVINLSLGGDFPSSAMENAVNYAVAKGVSVVAAAGNSGTLGALYPARYSAAIAVGSLDSNLQHSNFSNYGPDVDIWAPGGNVMSINLSGGYGSGSGTSFASPYVAGAKAIDLALNRATPLTGGNLDFNDASSIVILPSAPADTGSNVTIAAAPGNDNFASATNITSLPYNVVIDTTGATTEAGDPALPVTPLPTMCDSPDINSPGQNSHSVWYSYTTGATGGRLNVHTRSSTYNTVIAIWTKPAGSLIEFACNNNEPSNPGTTIITSYLEKDVTGNTTYYIEVMSFGTTAGGSLHFNFDYAPNPVPANNLFSGAIIIPQPPTPTSIYSYTNTQDTRLADRSSDDPDACDSSGNPLQGGASVWYKYIVPDGTPSNFKIRIDTKGSTYDTTLSVWTGSAPGSLTKIGCNDDIGPWEGAFSNNSSLKITVTSGTTYYILVTSHDIYGAGSLSSAADKAGDVSAQYDGGSMTLNLYSPAPAPTSFAPITMWTTNFNYSQEGWRIEKHPRIVADVNGDGNDDLVGFGYNGVWVALSNGYGFNPISMWTTNFNYSGEGWRVEMHPRMAGDVDGDGCDDLIGFGYQGVWVALSNSCGTTHSPSFAPISMWTTNFNYSQEGWRIEKHPRMVADVNGDGNADLVGFGYAGVWVALSNGVNGFEPITMWTTDYSYNQAWRVDMHPRMLADVNGDGSADVVGFGYAGVWVALSNGVNGFEPITMWTTDYSYNQAWRVNMHPRMLADVNGDGNADLVGFGYNGVWVALSDGVDSFAPITMWTTNFNYSGEGWRVEKHPRMAGDVNGDGNDDLIGFGYNGVWVGIAH